MKITTLCLLFGWVHALKPSLPTNNAEISRRDAIKATTAMSTAASIFLPTTQSLALPLDAPVSISDAPAVSISAAGKATLPKMGLGAWAWGDSLFWGYSKDEDKELEQGEEGRNQISSTHQSNNQ